MKKVVILNESTGTSFGIKGRDVAVSETMSLADAEFIKEQYPGVYVDVVDKPAAALISSETKAPKQA